ncbi:MAG: transposase [Candidatus Omnitrophota bacterium]
MPRIARVVVPDYPHHIVQRGNRRQKVFFNENDYNEYLKLLGEYTKRFKVDILAYCLMPNHVHLVVTPRQQGNLARAIGETHRNYTRFINFREKWQGYLWQGRFSSYVLDERHLLAVIRYILLNPVKAKIVTKPWDYIYSSAQHHLRINGNSLVKDDLLQELIDNWKGFLAVFPTDGDVELLRLHERTGRPLGDNHFIEKLEDILKINLKKKKAGRKKKKD